METEIYNDGKGVTTICVRGDTTAESGNTPEAVAQAYVSARKIIDENKTEGES